MEKCCWTARSLTKVSVHISIIYTFMKYIQKRVDHTWKIFSFVVVIDYVCFTKTLKLYCRI